MGVTLCRGFRIQLSGVGDCNSYKRMRLQKLYAIVAALGAVLSTAACPSEKHSAPLLPAKQAGAPALTASNAAVPVPENPNPAQNKIPEPSVPQANAPSADPVADLVAKVEKE